MQSKPVVREISLFNEDGSVRTLAEIEQLVIEAAVDRYGPCQRSGDRARVIARELGISRSTFFTKMKRYEDVRNRPKIQG